MVGCPPGASASNPVDTLDAGNHSNSSPSNIPYGNIVTGGGAVQNSISNIRSVTSGVGNTRDTGNPSSLIQELRFKLLDDINHVRTSRNMEHLVRRNADEKGVEDDEEMMTIEGFGAMFPPTNTTIQSLHASTVSKSTVRDANDSGQWAYTDADAATNTQHAMLHSIPAQLIAMVNNHVYVPLSFYLVESMDRIRLERNIKSTKSLTKPIRIIHHSNFIDEKCLSQSQFIQAYQNFIRCMKACMKPGSTLPDAWADHFSRSFRDPRMIANFKSYLYMDIKMRQQLVDTLFAPIVGSRQYMDAFALAQWEVNEEKMADLARVVSVVKNKLASRFGTHTPRDNLRYHPYHAGANSGGNNFQAGGSSSNDVGSGSAESFRGKAPTRNPRPRICLRCGITDGHISLQCGAAAMHKHQDRKPNISVRDKKLFFDSDSMPVCFKFNLHGSCPSDHPNHPPHRCTLCLAPFHGAVQCTRL